MTRENLIQNILTSEMSKGVEVGCFKGEFSKFILDNWLGELYMIDVWYELDRMEYDDISNMHYMDGIMFDAMKNIEGFEHRAFMMRMRSNQASKMFPDDSLDFVYIDANHKYDAVKEDLRLWYPKLKSGGIFMGHDYLKMDWSHPPYAENGKDKFIYANDGSNKPMKYSGLYGVNPAVDEFAIEYGYTVSQTDEWFGTWYFRKS